MSVCPPLQATTEVVVNQIVRMHTEPGAANQVSEWLSQVQQGSNAWKISIDILAAQPQPGEIVLHFAAQTLTRKVQSAALETCKEYNVSDKLQELTAQYAKTGPQSVLTQMCVGLAALAAVNHPQLEVSKALGWLSENSGQSANPVLFEAMARFPEEALSDRIALTHEKRQVYLESLATSWQGVMTSCEAAIERYGTVDQFVVAISRVLTQWVHLQPNVPSIKRQKETTHSFICPLVQDSGKTWFSWVMNHFSKSANQNIQVSRIFGDCIGELMGCTNVFTNETMPFIKAIAETVLKFCEDVRQQCPVNEPYEDESPRVEKALLACRLLADFTRSGHLCRMLSENKSPPECMEIARKMAAVAGHFLMFRNHEVARAAAGFWYDTLSVHFGMLRSEDDNNLSTSRSAPMFNESPEESAIRRQGELKQLIPLFTSWLEECIFTALCFPVNPEQDTFFEADEFVRFREDMAHTLCESCVILEASTIIEAVGKRLEVVTQPDHGWNQVEVCLFLLTTVAPRAPAGGDAVIPRMLELLPGITFPDSGKAALLVRCGAGRLIQYTSGFLGVQQDLLARILEFLTSNLIPATLVPLPPGADQNYQELRRYVEIVCCDALKNCMVSGKDTIIQYGDETWRRIVTVVIGLIANKNAEGKPSYHVDNRAMMVFGVGAVLSALPNWADVEQMLIVFTDTMARDVPEALKMPVDGKGRAPPALKLYLASVASVRLSEMPQGAREIPATHPVFTVLERNWKTLTEICAGSGGMYEDFVEQLCLSFAYILGHARVFATRSVNGQPGGHPLLRAMFELSAQTFSRNPSHHFLGMMKQLVCMFREVEEVTEVMLQALEAFCSRVVECMGKEEQFGPIKLPAILASQPLVPANCFDLLAESLRMPQIARSLMVKSWFPFMFGVVLKLLSMVEAAIVNSKILDMALRYLAMVLGWCVVPTSPEDPESAAARTAAMALVTEVERSAEPNGQPAGFKALLRPVLRPLGMQDAQGQTLAYCSIGLRHLFQRAGAPGGNGQRFLEDFGAVCIEVVPHVGQNNIQLYFTNLTRTVEDGREFGKSFNDFADCCKQQTRTALFSQQAGYSR